MSTPEFYDDRETRAPADREADLFGRLPEHIARAQREAPAYRSVLAGIEAASVIDRAALARLPVTRKSDLPDAQAADPPFGGYVTVPPGQVRRIFMSPGPIFDVDGAGRDAWRTARALFATGFRPGDVIQNCFAYHFTPAGHMFETGAEALGCAVIPAGVGNTEQQAQAMAAVRPAGYVGTPDFLKTILEKADALGLDVASVARAHVSGGPLFPELAAWYRDRGVTVRQSYGTADLGLIAYETQAAEGLVLAEDIIVEIVRPGTGDPVPEGEVGEVVVTGFSPIYPLIRFATGDLSAILPGQSPCGRTNARIKGWMGRADQTTKVRGMFVHPRQVAEIVSRHLPAGTRARLTVTASEGRDQMALAVEAVGEPEGLVDKLADTLQAVTKLRGAVSLVAPGSLPNDGKVIEDARR